MMDNSFIVSAQWLSEHLADSAKENIELAIADCRFSLADPNLGEQQYQAGHIPGAHYLSLDRDLASAVQQHGGRHPLPNPDQLAAKLSSIGVTSQKTLVVAYDDSRFAFASRLWWLLRYMGHDRVVVLDGGWKGWQAGGYPVSQAVPTVTPGNFIPQLKPEMVVDIDTVKARKDLPEVALVDSRERDRYLGKVEPIDPIAGHIPGAVNYCWQDVTDPEAKAKPASEQRQRWTEIEAAKEIIVYCGSGVTACVNLLSLEMAGIADAKLYVGSWSDWCSYL
ncbi:MULTISPECIES: sulfurtransferase [Planktothricoides]|uniref:Sulfurtransferase n=2 Tax=Planktothricoides raciborskii TaxID=132608 RepID=A0AAU8JP24_9CYAN|nr:MULTISPECIES: sulfurtransferase [Planktothricoides]KOR38238.1 3-mercaptopyruvate sulfurtransferase [Planktothricoides sp. SR001]MBD2544464.1 sulfurtransferase [Planktothricoides raciborskii FACHB-1370]MBD2585727.1 sulfurtransferase [Planktothricoides raciborskii FACHB-1261]